MIPELNTSQLADLQNRRCTTQVGGNSREQPVKPISANEKGLLALICFGCIGYVQTSLVPFVLRCTHNTCSTILVFFPHMRTINGLLGINYDLCTSHEKIPVRGVLKVSKKCSS